MFNIGREVDTVRLIKLLAKYSLAGVVNGLVSYCLIFACMALGGTPVWSNVVGYAAGFLTSFLQSRNWVFKSSNGLHGDLARFVVSFAISFVANLAALRLLLRMDVNVYVAQLAACGAYVVTGFLLSSMFVFRNRPR